MNKLDENEKRSELRNCLIGLSEKQKLLKAENKKEEYFQKLEEIYWNSDGENFRHFYSDIFATISLIDADDSLGDINILAENMEMIKNGYTAQNFDDKGTLVNIKKEILKLYDHVNLDISRINYMKRIMDETESEISRNKYLLSALEENIQESNEAREASVETLKKDTEQIKNDIKSSQAKMQGEYITILGIFASIVLAFTGGLAFSTSVLENINAVSPYRLALVVEGLAFVFINVMYILVWFIQKIHGSGDLKYPDFMKWINAIIIVAAIATMICWHAGAIERVEAENQLQFMTLK